MNEAVMLALGQKNLHTHTQLVTDARREFAAHVRADHAASEERAALLETIDDELDEYNERLQEEKAAGDNVSKRQESVLSSGALEMYAQPLYDPVLSAADEAAINEMLA
jgi:hypothetical protein